MKKIIILILNPDLSVKAEVIGHKAAAQYLGIPIDTVRTRVYRWRRHYKCGSLVVIKREQYKELLLSEIEKSRLSIQAARLKLDRVGFLDPQDIQATRDRIIDKRERLKGLQGLYGKQFK